MLVLIADANEDIFVVHKLFAERRTDGHTRTPASLQRFALCGVLEQPRDSVIAIA